jgi:hypothetical protein
VTSTGQQPSNGEFITEERHHLFFITMNVPMFSVVPVEDISIMGAGTASLTYEYKSVKVMNTQEHQKEPSPWLERNEDVGPNTKYEPCTTFICSYIFLRAVTWMVGLF